MSTVKQVSLNTVYQVIAKFVTSFSTLLITLLITRNIGVEGYGQFSIIMTYSALFYLAVDFGVNAVATRDMTSDESKIPYYFRNLLALRLVMAVVVMMFALGLLSFLPYNAGLKIGIIVGIFTILTQALFTSVNAVFQTKLSYHRSALADIIGALVILLISFIVATLKGSVFMIVVAFVLGGFVRFLIGMLLLRGFTKGIGLKADIGLWKKLLILAFPLGLSAVLGQINGNADKFIISISTLPGGMTNETAAGLYGLAYKIFEVILVVPTFFVNAAYPVMIKHFNEGKDRFVRTLKSMYWAMIAISIPISLAGFVLAPYIINFFKGGEGDFSVSISLLQILVLGLPVFYLSAVSLWLVVTIGKQNFLIFVYGLAALINVFLNIILVPVYGIAAAAVLTIITEVLVIILTTTYGWYHISKIEVNREES